ncbi:hypothetical protein ACFX2C_014942 [Malus domestica]
MGRENADTLQNCSRALISATSEPKTFTTINFRHMKQPFSRPTKDSSGTGMMGYLFSSDTIEPVSLFYSSLSAKIAETQKSSPPTSSNAMQVKNI